LCKYPLLFRELIKYTPEEHADFEFFKNMLKKVEEAAQFANKTCEGEENIRKLMAWNDIIRDWSALINDKVNRKAIEDEWIIVKYTESEKVITNARHAYLFNDILVLTKLVTSKGEKKSEGLKDVIILRYCQVESLPDTAKVSNAISLSISTDDYVNTWILMFRIPGSKILWLKLLGDYISSQKSNNEHTEEDEQFIPELEKKNPKGRFKVRGVTKKLIRSTSIIRKRDEIKDKDKDKEVPKTVIFAEKQELEGDPEDLFDFLTDLKNTKKEKNKGSLNHSDVPSLPLSSIENLPHAASTPDLYLISPQSGRASLRRTTDDGDSKKANTQRFSVGSRTPKTLSAKFDILQQGLSAVASRSDGKKRNTSRSTGSHSERHHSKPKESLSMGYLSDN